MTKLVVAWDRRLKGFAHGNVVLGDAVLVWDGALTAHDLASGATRWVAKPKKVTPRAVSGAVATDRHFVAMLDDRGRDVIFVWLDPATGNEVGRTAIPSTEDAVRNGFAGVASTVAVTEWRNPIHYADDGTSSLLSPIPESTLYLASADSPGALVRVVAEPGTYYYSVERSESRFIVGRARPIDVEASEMTTLALDAHGHPIWTSSAGSPSAATDAHVLCASEEALTLLDATSGAVLWTQPGAPGFAGIAGDLALSAPYRGSLAAYDLATGAKRWEQPKAEGTATFGWDGTHVYMQVSGQPLVALAPRDGAEVMRCASTSSASRPIRCLGTRVLVTEDEAKGPSFKVYDWGGAVTPKPRMPPKPGSLAARLESFIRVFSARSDIRVLASTLGDPLGEATFDKRIPKELRELSAVFGTIDFAWTFAREDDRAQGRLRLDLNAATELREAEDWMEGYVAFADGVDDIEPECAGWVVVPKGKKAATFAFYDANDGDLTLYATPDAYFREAARHAFLFYWPKASGKGEADALLRASAAGTRDALVARAAKIVDAKSAADLVDWLGDRASILFSR